jgi:hypothetical protein
MSVTTIVADPVSDQEDRDRGHDDDHQESPHGYSASSITPPEEHHRGGNKDNCDLCDIIHGRDARAELKTGTEIGSVKSKNNTVKGTIITMVLIMTNLTWSDHQKWDISQEASRRTLET